VNRNIWLFLFQTTCYMRILLFVYFILLCASAEAQAPAQPLYSKAQLEAKRKEYQDAINETEKELSEIKKDKNATISQLRTLQNNLEQRQKLIGNINEEIGDIDNSIRNSSKEVMTLKQKLELLKTRYAQSVRYAYETRSSFGMLAFLFSSSDFNDAMRRMKYLKQFRDFRKQEVQQIRLTQNQLQHKIGELNSTKEQKDKLLVNEEEQKKELQQKTNQTNDVVNQLKGREKELMANIEKNRVLANRINKAIQVYIEAEMEKEAKKVTAAQNAKASTPGKQPANTAPVNNGVTNPGAVTHTKAPKAETPTLLLTPTDVALADKFESNKGKLPWPVEKGVITDRFGKHPHPVYTRIIIINNGVDIQSDANAPVRSVFEGDVFKVFSVDQGSTQCVAIRHGNYITLYNGLGDASVKAGDHVSTKQLIGHIGKNIDDLPVVNFQVWKSGSGKKSQVALDPEKWLAKAK